MPPPIDMRWKRFGKLIVIADRDSSGNLFFKGEYRHVIIQCDCGRIRSSNARSIWRGRTLSCGCLQKQAAKKHGLESTNIYKVWNAMIHRCYNVKQTSYRYYGAKDIQVCPEWWNVKNFYSWAKTRWVKGLTLDRINPRGDYSPENCRWATPKQQANNRTDNRLITIFDETLTIANAADKYGIPYDRLRQRVTKLGWPPEKAISNGCWPNDKRVKEAPIVEPNDDVKGWIKYQAIRRAHSR